MLIKNADTFMVNYICNNVGRREMEDGKMTNVDIDFDIQNHAGLTALMIACQGGHVDIVRILLANNIKSEKDDKMGSTALIYAVRADSPVCVRALLEIPKLDVRWKDKINRSALDYAKDPIVRELLNEHCRRNVVGTVGTLISKSGSDRKPEDLGVTSGPLGRSF
jgi:ankyrin repeat protein